jgi:UDP-N-acetylmuramoyl-tripeptide--D-alanyl-D-alanine ligase
MKFIFKKILQYYLKYITKFVLFIHRPTIIAIAGSTNKTFVKDEISKILKESSFAKATEDGEGINPAPFRQSISDTKRQLPERCGVSVRSNPKSFNTEIGLPLAILNLPSGYNSYKNWLPIIFKAGIKIFQFNFPKFLVLEVGVSDPGDMKYLLTIIKPKIVVITDITQRYLEGFEDMDALVEEYEYLVKKVNKKGLVVLNYDNPRIKKMANISRNKIKFFGFGDGADCRAVEIKKESGGQLIKIKHNNILSEHKINRFGNHHIYALLVGLIIKQYPKSFNT